jgi:tetratricopeptide (TPR) repeat protein
VQPDRTTTRLFALFLRFCGHIGSGDGEDTVKLHELARRMVAAAPDLAMAQALYAVASVSMADIVRHQGFVAAAEDHIADGRSAAERALRIDPDNGTANCALAWTYSRAPAHWIQFETYLRRIDDADASFPYALHDLTWLARATGRLGDAINLNRRAAELDPYSSFKATALAWQLAMAGRLPEADVLLTRSEALWPNARTVADYRLQIATWYRPPDAAEEVLRSSAIGISDSEFACLSLLLDARRGHRVEHQHLRRTCAGAVRADHVPRVLAILGDVDEAFRELDAIDFSGGLADTIPLFFPELRAVRHDPRFMPLALRIGLVDYWLNTDRWPDFCADPDLPYDCKQVAASLVRPEATSARPPAAELAGT